jgi:hypothetical protein
VPIHRSAIAFARGARTGAQDTDALAGEHGIEDAGELAVAVPDQEPEGRCAVAEVHQEIAPLLSNPGSARVRGDSEEVYGAGGVLYEEQDIKSLEQQRVDIEEVRGQNAPGLHAQELSPAQPVAARCGVDTGSLQDQPHRTRRNLVAKSDEFALDPSVPPGGVLRGQPQDQPAQFGCRAAAAGSAASGLGPASFHQVPVPPQDRGGGDDPMQSASLGQ